MSRRKTNTRGILRREIPLNALALGVAISGFLIPVFTQSPSDFVQDARGMLADSGTALSAAIPPNPYNSLADQLDQKEQELNQREAALDARSSNGLFATGNIYGFISFILSLILCGLVGLNFYLDSRRGKKRGFLPGKYSVDLS